MALNRLVFSAEDNVAVLLESGKPGEMMSAGGEEIPLVSVVPRGFKVALKNMSQGDSVVKYGVPIGRASQPILRGELVHGHNLKSSLTETLELPPWARPQSPLPRAGEKGQRTFRGYRRRNGRVGIRNELWIIPTVGCISGLLRNLIKNYAKAPWITAIRVLEHPWGCSQSGDDLEQTRKLLLGLAQNPNAAGVLVAALGCENLQLDALLPSLVSVPNLVTLSLQDEREEKPLLWSKLDDLARRSERQRQECPLSALALAVKCGGSDAFSGITANPLLGRLADRVTSAGGTVMLGEIPEMFGAETGIASRCISREVHEKLIRAFRSFRNYYAQHQVPVYENPSPGNRAGGITTLEEKSLGAVSKSGSSLVVDVLDYGESYCRPGLNVTCSPGNDPVSCTALVAAGAVMILFSTGRGTPFGTVVPTMKVSTNLDLTEGKPHWIDFDASSVIAEGMEAVENRLIDHVIRIANGEKTKNELNDIADISIFKGGVIL